MMGKFCSRMMQMVAGHCRYIKFHRIVHFKMVKTASFPFGVFYHHKQLSGDIQAGGTGLCSVRCRNWASDVQPGLRGRH